ncbi:MAG: Late control protein D [Hyphomonadaceae bacterium]|nr:MAG: Late control protein D [Hyphomonadaceae bacterium]
MPEEVAGETVIVTGIRNRLNRKLPFAQMRVSLAGIDLSDKIDPRLISLSICEKRGNEADQLDLVLHDRDGDLEIPKTGALLKVELGWKYGENLPIGLIDKGSFKVDEISIAGPPDLITIRARSADLTRNFRNRTAQAFIGKSVGEIIDAIAAKNGIRAMVDQELRGEIVPAIARNHQSDAALLRELGRRFDAVATVKNQILIFSRIGGETASGLVIPKLTISRRDTSSFSYSQVEHQNHNGTEAVYRNRQTAQHLTVREGHNEQSPRNPHRLRHVHHNENDARQRARAHHRRTKRGKFKLELDLALGRPDYYPNRQVNVFKAEIDAKSWLIAEATHSLDGSGGLQTKLSLETA